MDNEARKRGMNGDRPYALTAAEAAVANLIAQGRAVKQIAAQLGISEQTVRVHLRRIFAKTGVHRQAALVHLLLEKRRSGRPPGPDAIAELTPRRPNATTRRSR